MNKKILRSEKVLKVEALDDYVLKLWFENGKVKLFDMKYLLSHNLYKPLLNYEYFKQVMPRSDTVCWPPGDVIDICPDGSIEIEIN